MSAMNRKYMILVLGIIDLLTVVLIIALAAMDKISETTFWTALIVVCLAATPLLYLVSHSVTAGIKSPQEQAAELGDDIDTDNLKLPRTLETSIFEAITATILIAALVAWFTTHCAGLDGRGMAGFVMLPIWLLIRAYTPRPSFLWGEMHNLVQVYISARLMRILAIMIAIGGLLRACIWFYTPVMGDICNGVTLLNYIVGRIIQIVVWKKQSKL
jgi:hypothetical protein